VGIGRGWVVSLELALEVLDGKSCPLVVEEVVDQTSVLLGGRKGSIRENTGERSSS